MGAMQTVFKRILHYVILAALLIGTPLACCLLGGYGEILEGVKNFPPRTEDWGAHPENLWNYKCPFSWTCFVVLVVFTILVMWPFVRRCLKAAFATNHSSQTTNHAFPWWGWLGLVVMVAGWILSWNWHFHWFPPLSKLLQIQLSYAPIWAGFILVMNALCVKRSGHSPMTDHPWAYAATFPASSLFWWFFEYLNRYVWNWYYVGIEDLSAMGYTVYATICFASVLPGVCAVAAFLHTFRPFADEHYAHMARMNLRSGWAVCVLAAVAALGLAGIVFFPSYAFPLLWLSPLTVFLLVQVVLKEPCAFDCLADGNWSVLFRFSLAALICGFCWETWNYYALAKWVYAVPWVHRFQIWEMPFIGFGGYLPFGLECAAVTAWIHPNLIEPCWGKTV